MGRRQPAPGPPTIAARTSALPAVWNYESSDRTAADKGGATAADRTAADRTAADRTAADPAAADRAAAEAAERAGIGRTVGDPAEGEAAGGSALPRRRPGAAAAARRRNGAAGVDDATVEMGRPTRPATRLHPAADERAYSRLDAETDRVAEAVAASRMEFRHAVAKIALAAPGRIDLLDRVIETERRMAGIQIGAAAPSEVTLKLLTTARRVVSGEIGLVGPTGVRVEQASSGLRLIHPDRTTREYRSANELARHLDLDTLSVDAPTS